MLNTLLNCVINQHCSLVLWDANKMLFDDLTEKPLPNRSIFSIFDCSSIYGKNKAENEIQNEYNWIFER